MVTELQNRLRARNVGYAIAARDADVSLRTRTPVEDMRDLIALFDFAELVNPGRDELDDRNDHEWMLRRLRTMSHG